MHPKSVPSSFLGASTLPQEQKLETADSPRQSNCQELMESQKMYELTLIASSVSLEAVLETKQIALAALLDKLDESLSNFAMLTNKSMRTSSTYCALQLNAWRYLRI